MSAPESLESCIRVHPDDAMKAWEWLQKLCTQEGAPPESRIALLAWHEAMKEIARYKQYTIIPQPDGSEVTIACPPLPNALFHAFGLRCPKCGEKFPNSYTKPCPCGGTYLYRSSTV